MNLPSPPQPDPSDPQPNPSYGFGPSENLTDAEIAANRAEYEMAERLEDLEYAVLEAAINLIQINKPTVPAHACIHAYDDLKAAVDALLREREGK